MNVVGMWYSIALKLDLHRTLNGLSLSSWCSETEKAIKLNKLLFRKYIVQKAGNKPKGSIHLDRLDKCVIFKHQAMKTYHWLIKHRTMKTYWRSEGMAPRILNLSTRWKWVVSLTPRSLYPLGKSPWYPLDKMLGGPQSRKGWVCGNM
jgi:hypothetical protein